MSKIALYRYISHQIKAFSRRFRGLSITKQFIVSLIGILLLFSGLLAISFFVPRSVTLSYSGETCTNQVLLLPQLYESTGDSVNAYVGSSYGLGSYPLISSSLCFDLNEVPIPNRTMNAYIALRSAAFLQHRVTLDVPEYPKVESDMQAFSPEVSTRDSLSLNMSYPDMLFEYHIATTERQQQCEKQDERLSCGFQELELEQAKEYDVRVERTFKTNVVNEVAKHRIKTLDPVEVVESSIEAGKVAYEKPQQLEVAFNKPVQDIEKEAISLTTDNDETLDFTAESQGDTLVVSFAEELSRESTVVLELAQALAQDNSELTEPWSLTFETSGGPELTTHNVNQTSLSQSHRFVVTFDQALADDPASLDSLVRLRSGGADIEFSSSTDGKQLVVTPASQLPLCSDLQISLKGDIASTHDVSSPIDWSQGSRTTCNQTSIIGYSTQGRPIRAHTFGNGSQSILYVGGMHGNEYSSVVLLDEWIKELDANPERIPDNKKLIIIPESCPDCVVARSRLNVNNVDLNRNFPTNDWQSEVYIPGPTHLPGGGGGSALSEPEAKALADLVRRERPKLTLTYHAVADIVISNDAGNSIPWGREYARLSNYGFSTTNDIENVFDYAATGAFEDWIYDELSLPALLVELATMAGNEIDRNRDALWYTVNLP